MAKKNHQPKKVQSISTALQKHKGSVVIIVELPAEAYFETNIHSIKSLLKAGFDGVYLSFQRPFGNVSASFKDNNIALNRIMIVDAVSACAGAVPKDTKDSRCVSVSQELSIDEIVRAIYTSLEKLKAKKKFVFLDSLTTLALYKPLSEVMRFSEFLMETAKEEPGTIILLNVAKDLRQKKFIQDIALKVDEIVAV